MWKLHNLATAYGTRPSEILGVDDGYLAYQVDLACLTFGRYVENKLAERTSKGRPKYTVEALVAEPDELLGKKAATGAGYASWRSLVGKQGVEID